MKVIRSDAGFDSGRFFPICWSRCLVPGLLSGIEFAIRRTSGGMGQGDEMRRRDVLRILMGAAVAWPAVTWPTAARAQGSSGRPIIMIVPFPAGGGADVLVRILTKQHGGEARRDHRGAEPAGAGGALAFGQLARAAPDGHTAGLGFDRLVRYWRPRSPISASIRGGISSMSAMSPRTRSCWSSIRSCR